MHAAGQRQELSAPSSWLDHAVSLPVAFAQVREDPLIDQWVVDRLPDRARICMVASGGCTAALLACHPRVASIQLVDPNPAQLALCRLKLRLLCQAPPEVRARRLGHSAMPIDERRRWLIDELSDRPDVLGSLEFVAHMGPDFSGRYERLFAALQQHLATVRRDLEDLLSLTDSTEQRSRIESRTALGREIDAAFDDILSLETLQRLFGAGATRNPVEPFSRHFAARLRWVLATQPAADNPWLWQLLTGRYPPSRPAPWLEAPCPDRLPQITESISFMDDALERCRQEFDFVHLSNILDWLDPAAAARTLDLAWRALHPGGWILIRQLNSSLNIPDLGPQFCWQTETSRQMLARDRSFFYRELHPGRRT